MYAEPVSVNLKPSKLGATNSYTNLEMSATPLCFPFERGKRTSLGEEEC